jgi:hypothetical protein
MTAQRAPDMIEDGAAPNRRTLTWNGVAADERTMAGPVSNFLGGSPLNVILRLIFMSLIVGALLMWLDIRPWDVIAGLERLVRRLWNMGFDALRVIFEYVVAGAIIVVPIWLVLRLMNARGGR